MNGRPHLLVAMSLLQAPSYALGEMPGEGRQRSFDPESTLVIAQATSSASVAQPSSPGSSSPATAAEGAPALLRAVAENNLDLVSQLVAQGSSVNEIWRGQSPLALAVGNNNYDMTALLLKSGARPAYDTPRSILFAACFMRECDARMKPLLIRAYLDQSADEHFAKTGRRAAPLRKVPTDDQLSDAIFAVVRKPGWAPPSLREAESLIVNAAGVWVILTYVAVHNADLNQVRAEAHILYGAGQSGFVTPGLKSQNRQPVYFVISPGPGNSWQARVGQ